MAKRTYDKIGKADISGPQINDAEERKKVAKETNEDDSSMKAQTEAPFLLPGERPLKLRKPGRKPKARKRKSKEPQGPELSKLGKYTVTKKEESQGSQATDLGTLGRYKVTRAEERLQVKKRRVKRAGEQGMRQFNSRESMYHVECDFDRDDMLHNVATKEGGFMRVNGGNYAST
jgi:hypothetical protein